MAQAFVRVTVKHADIGKIIHTCDYLCVCNNAYAQIITRIISENTGNFILVCHTEKKNNRKKENKTTFIG